jgi:hypothetical protein
MSTALATRSTTLLAPQLDYFLIDGSGSMKSKWWDTLAALDGYADTLRKANQNAHGIVSVFSGLDLQMIQRDGLLDEWRPFYDQPLAQTF